MNYLGSLIVILLFNLSTTSYAQTYQFTTGHGDIQQLRVANLFVMQALEESNVKEIMSTLAQKNSVQEKDIKRATTLISKKYKENVINITGIMNTNKTEQAWYRRTYFSKENNVLKPLYQVRVLFEKGTSDKVASIEFISSKDIDVNSNALKKAQEDLVTYEDYLLE